MALSDQQYGTTMCAMRPPSDGESFLMTANQLLAGAAALADINLPALLPGALLSAQALETGLKALLWTAGRTTSELRNPPLGHDLVALWTEAAHKGLLAVSPPDWCILLNSLHAFPYKGRYPSGLNGFQTPNAKATVGKLAIILELATKAVQSAPWRPPST